MPLLARALQLHARSDLAVVVVAAVPVASRRRLIGGRHHWELRRAGEGRGSKRERKEVRYSGAATGVRVASEGEAVAACPGDQPPARQERGGRLAGEASKREERLESER